MSLSHRILETIGQSALDKGLVDKREYSKVKDLHRGQKEAHRKAKKLGIEDRYLPKDISQEDFIKDIDSEEKYKLKESNIPIAPLEKRKPHRVFVVGDRVILRKLHNPDFYTEDYVRYYNENYKGKTGVIESKHYQGTLPIYTVKFDDPMLYKDYYEDSTVNVQAEDIDFYDEIKESTRYGDIDPEAVKDDAFLNINKNENGYSVKAGIGDHTDLGSGNYTFIPDNEVSRLYNEVLDKVKSKKIKYHDKLGKEEVKRLDSIIPNYNKDLEQDIKDLEPYANRPLKRKELDDILDITGRRDASGSSERQMKHRLSGDYGKLSSKVGDLKRYLSDLDDDNITEFWIN